MEAIFFLNGLICVKVGDITKEKTQAIVNAANSTLLGGGGVDGSIHRVGGRSILEDCRLIRKKYVQGLPVGEAVLSSAGRLYASYVIHTVGPIWKGGNDNESIQLASCYENCLKLAFANRIESITFPAISAGAYGYPLDLAAKVSAVKIQAFLEKNSGIQKVVLIFFKRKYQEVFLESTKNILY